MLIDHASWHVLDGFLLWRVAQYRDIIMLAMSSSLPGRGVHSVFVTNRRLSCLQSWEATFKSLHDLVITQKFVFVLENYEIQQFRHDGSRLYTWSENYSCCFHTFLLTITPTGSLAVVGRPRTGASFGCQSIVILKSSGSFVRKFGVAGSAGRICSNSEELFVNVCYSII